jgi:hypothetical protein
MSATAETNQCLICRVVVAGQTFCTHCMEEISSREAVYLIERQLRSAEQAVAAAQTALAAARQREQTATERLVQARRQAEEHRRRRVQRTNPPIHQATLLTPVTNPRGRVTNIEPAPATSSNRGRERDSDEDEVEVVGPPGTPCGRGWLRRRTTPRPRAQASTGDMSDEDAGPECLLCYTTARDAGVESHCHRMSCTYETCLVCWTRLIESENPTCPNSRLVIRDNN